MSYVFLSGGTGTPKLLQGMRKLLDDIELSIITNPGDDYDWYGLRVCPDLDTILYLFSQKLDTDKFWGVRDDTFLALQTLDSLGVETWFQVGDRDLGLHIYRTSLLHSNHSIQDVIHLVSKAWGIQAKIYHATLDTIRSFVHTSVGILPFQEFWVKHHGHPRIQRVEFRVQPSHPTPPKGLVNSIKHAKAIIIGPSNPITSIGPILMVPQIKEALQAVRDKVVVVSPFQAGKAFSGPAARMMEANGFSVDIEGLYRYYKDIAGTYVIHHTESKEFNVDDASVYRTDTQMNDLASKTRLSREILDLFG